MLRGYWVPRAQLDLQQCQRGFFFACHGPSSLTVFFVCFSVEEVALAVKHGAAVGDIGDGGAKGAPKAPELKVA